MLLAMMSNAVVDGIYFGSQAKSVRREAAWRFELLALTHEARGVPPAGASTSPARARM